jgi:hypothetical protein
MGYHVQLVAKTKDKEKGFKIHKCQEKKGYCLLSQAFSMFQSRNFKGCELKQVEKILNIDLSIYWNYPGNYEPDTGELEYRLYQANQEGDIQKAAQIQHKIEEVEKQWEENYYRIHDGWTTIEDLRNVTVLLKNKISQRPDFGKYIKVASGWDYPWNDYFSLLPKKDGWDSRLLDDLEKILYTLHCIEQQGEQYVAFIGF